jgi:hypothetical protein
MAVENTNRSRTPSRSAHRSAQKVVSRPGWNYTVASRWVPGVTGRHRVMNHHPIFPFLAGLVFVSLLFGCTPATPVPTPTLWPTEESPTPTPPPTDTPAKVDMWCDLWLNLDGPTGAIASRRPRFAFEAEVQDPHAAQVQVESPSGEKYTLPPFHDIPYGRAQRFDSPGVQGVPEVGKPYTCTALTAGGVPIPGAVAYDVYLGGKEPDPPTQVRAEVIADGVQIAWSPSPIIAGAFDPGGSPQIGYYVIFLYGEKGELLYGWTGGVSSSAPSHLIPLHRQDLGPDDAGQALEGLSDGAYRVDVNARSVAAFGIARRNDECISKDSAQDIQVIIEKGQVRAEAP